jgi:predicted ATPase
MFLLKKIGIDNVLKLPDLQNPELIARQQIMIHLSTCAYYVNPNLFALITLMGINTFLKNGLTPHSGLSFISFANLIQTVFGNYEQAFRIGEMALKLNDQFKDRSTAGRLHHLFAFFIHHWKRHLKSELEIYPKVFELSMNAGDFITKNDIAQNNASKTFLQFMYKW